MRRPLLTRRLSIAALVSSAVFVVVAAAAIRSFWIWDRWGFTGYKRMVVIESGCILYAQDVSNNANGFVRPRSVGHTSGEQRNKGLQPGVLGFYIHTLSGRNPVWGFERIFFLRVPLWFPLLFLLIAPMRWLLAKRARNLAFPAITNANLG